ncbi:MAG: AAA family ATPase [Myxococcota bacterium]
MSAYLKFFELEQSPFEGKAQSQVVLGTRALRDAFGTIRAGLDEGASRICVGGGAGLGKTSLARALPKLLGEAARVANVLDASVEWQACRDAIARQWGLDAGRLSRAALIEARANRRLVLVIDQAERASEAFLDHLDVLLSYRTEEDTPVVQSVLLANLATREGDAAVPLLWWLDRIQTLQLEFAPLPREGVASYIAKHLRRAGWRGEALFSEEAGFAIHGYAGGIPGEISALCERLLVEAASQTRTEIDAAFVHAVCDPEPAPEAEPEHGAPSAAVDDDPARAGAGVEAAVPASPEGDEAPWTVPDEFEALMAEGDFTGAEEAVDPADAKDVGPAGTEAEDPGDAPPGMDETEVLRLEAETDAAPSADAVPSDLVPDSGLDALAELSHANLEVGVPVAPLDGPGTDAALPLVEEREEATTSAEPAPTATRLSDALEFFEAASRATPDEDGSEEAIELTREAAVEAPAAGVGATQAAEAEEEPWTFANEDTASAPERAQEADLEARAEPDAAFAPEPARPPEALDLFETAGPEEAFAAPEAAASTSARRLPIVPIAVAASLAGLVFFVFGGDDDASSPMPLAAQPARAPSAAAPPLATPERGFVEATTIEALPPEILAEAVAVAEAISPLAGTGGAPPEPAALARIEPPDATAASKKNEPSVTIGARPSTAPSASEGARAPLEGTGPKEPPTAVVETPESIPAAPAPLPAFVEDERFW